MVGRWAPPPLKVLSTPLEVVRTMIVAVVIDDDWMVADEEAVGAYCCVVFERSR